MQGAADSKLDGTAEPESPVVDLRFALAAGLALAAVCVVLWAFGFTWLSALGIAFLISCPALGIWTLREARASFAERDRC